MSKRRRVVSTLVALSLYSYVGETIRKITEEVFGLACHEPDRWMSEDSNWPICTTDPGTTSSTGGALFIDLPANMLGCFLIGVFVAGDVSLGTPVDMPIACISRSSKFQQWTVTHVGIRAGLCSSLTTLASWNTQMVTMLCAGNGTELPSQWMSVIFGYLVGWMTAVESYRFGRHLAVMLHRKNNPDLRQEADALAHSQYIVIHRDLPDLERRYLYDTGTDSIDRMKNEDSIHHLQEWKGKTQQHRTTLDPLLKELHEIERTVIIENKEPQEYLMGVAADCGWDVKALQNWRQARGMPVEEETPEDPGMELWLNSLLLVSATAVFLWGAITQSGSTQAYFLSSLFDPFGTILRWRLSRLNGRIQNPKWAWLPIGTFAANMIACIISSFMRAATLKIPETFPLALLFVSSIKSGFAGSLSTVSAFVVESVELQRALPQHAYGYYYPILSFVTTGILGVICYVWAV